MEECQFSAAEQTQSDSTLQVLLNYRCCFRDMPPSSIFLLLLLKMSVFSLERFLQPQPKSFQPPLKNPHLFAQVDTFNICLTICFRQDSGPARRCEKTSQRRYARLIETFFLFSFSRKSFERFPLRKLHNFALNFAAGQIWQCVKASLHLNPSLMAPG